MNKTPTLIFVSVLMGLFVFEEAPAENTEERTTEQLTEIQCLVRTALDLQEVGPSVQDIEDFENGVKSYDDLVEDYLYTDNFETMVNGWFNEEFPRTMNTNNAPGMDLLEPGRILTYIVENDMDFRLGVNGDFTVDEDKILQPSNREAAGVLSTPHYMNSVQGIYRRNWAGRFINQFAGISLLAVPEDFQDSSDNSPEALAENPGCKGCHDNPIFGIDRVATFAACYGEDGLFIDGCNYDVESTFVTEEGAGLAGLGAITAESREFKARMVQFFVSKIYGRELAREEVDYFNELASAWEGDEMIVRDLIRKILKSEEYCSY